CPIPPRFLRQPLGRPPRNRSSTRTGRWRSMTSCTSLDRVARSMNGRRSFWVCSIGMMRRTTNCSPRGPAERNDLMRPLRYSINVTLDGCCDHRVMIADEDLHRHAVENLVQADALLFGRVTYEMMEAAWRPSARTGARPDWMEPFARTIDAARKYVVSSTLD